MTDEMGMRKDCAEPRFGLFSSLVVLAVLGGQTALSPSVLEGLENLGAQVWVGLMWGGWALSLWIFGNRPFTMPKAIVLASLFIWHSVWMSLLREQPIHRYWIMLGFFAFAFLGVAEFLPLPHWHRWAGPSPSCRPRRGQFGILAILLVTASVAVVMFAIKHYDKGSEQFLLGTVVVSCLLVIVAQCALQSAVFWKAPWLGFVVVIAAAWGAAWLMAFQDQTDGQAVVGMEILWPVYQVIATVFGVVIWGVGMCGRLDGLVRPACKVPARDRHPEHTNHDLESSSPGGG